MFGAGVRLEATFGFIGLGLLLTKLDFPGFSIPDAMAPRGTGGLKTTS